MAKDNRRIYKYQGVLIGDNRVNNMYSTDKIDSLLEEKVSLVDGKIPADELPSYLKLFNSKEDFPATGEAEFIYIDTSSNGMYRWDEETKEYSFIGGSLEIGDGPGTAYSGEKGAKLEADIENIEQTKQNKLTAGNGITIQEDGTITATAASSVVYGDGTESFPVKGVSGVIYMDTKSNTMYRWDEETSAYVQVGGISEGVILYGGNA